MCKKRPAKRAINYAVAQNISRAAVEPGTEATGQTETCRRSIKASDAVMKDSMMLFKDNQGLLPAGSHDMKPIMQKVSREC